MTLEPIAVFVYNRPSHVQRVLEALGRNPEASASDVFVFSDAAKAPAALPAVQEVRRRIRSAKGFGSVTVIEQEANLGVARSIIAGVGDLTRQFGKVVVLEDDLLPSRHFLRYMNDALDLYQDVPEVISVHAYCYPVKRPLPETFFLRGADCWGWGTWSRGWALFESDGRRLLSQLRERDLTFEFDLDGSYPYTRMLEDQIDGKNDSWAVRWYASAFLSERLTLYPGSSQVQNIGADGTGQHVGRTDVFGHSQWGRRTTVERTLIKESAEARQAFARFLRSTQPSFARRMIGRVRRLFA